MGRGSEDPEYKGGTWQPLEKKIKDYAEDTEFTEKRDPRPR